MKQQQEKEKAEKLLSENKERKIRRVRRTSERRKRLDTINSESDYSISETSDKSAARRKKKEKRRIAAASNNSPPPPKKSVCKTSEKGLKFNIASIDSPIRTSKERKAAAAEVGNILRFSPQRREKCQDSRGNSQSGTDT